MIVVTGAAGFIPSVLVGKLNREGFKNIVLVDDFDRADKKSNWTEKEYMETVHRDEFPEWLRANHRLVEFVFHLGARTDTTEFDVALFDRLNLNYTKEIWNNCVEFGLPLIYASSAATYGLGDFGYKDDHDIVDRLKPLNPYGDSKNDFDKWALAEKRKPYFWAGIKFFNVYGPNEYHKGRMASVVFHTFNQVQSTGGMKLFRSHNPEFKDGEQLRDFIYVEDAVDVLYWLMHHRKKESSGLYNLGTGQARSFIDLATATFKGMGLEPNISFIDTPEDIRDKYQYFTEADMSKLRNAGYDRPFTSLENGVEQYVKGYLLEGKRY
ncbi:MAG: ADP-glyceromanno-heptose 6-epimerase [Flavobacteriales bacterium]|nr:ADP-glyceromanno-heptose 6-epimerase [Flavobacteriales bacterium]